MCISVNAICYTIFNMLKRLGGFKAGAYTPPLLIPALPCNNSDNKLCNGFFIPIMHGQKSCLQCLNYKKENLFSTDITRIEILQSIILTWQNDDNWSKINNIIIENECIYKSYCSCKK